MNAQDLEKAVSERTADLERANRDLDAFARELAHEIGTSMGQVTAIAELLLRRARQLPSQSESCRWLELQASTAHRIQSTMLDLLELARGSSGAPGCESIDLAQMCAQLRDDLAVEPGHAPIEWHIAPGMHVGGRRSDIRLLMRNLLSNAIKYTRETPAPVVTVMSRDGDAGKVLVTVEDNGAGFDPQEADRLFQPFVRLHDPRRFEGTGIGLSLARRIAERHGGWIRAHGRKGAGARFEVALAAPPPAALPLTAPLLTVGAGP
jgi:signal transduction histidine kinase